MFQRSSSRAKGTALDSDESVGSGVDEMEEAPTQAISDNSESEEPSGHDEEVGIQTAPAARSLHDSAASTSTTKKSVSEMLLQIETRRLDVDKQRLQIEEKTLATLEQLVDIEKKKLELMIREHSGSNVPKPRPNVATVTQSLFEKLGKGVYKP